jgi:hypothetical protein
LSRCASSAAHSLNALAPRPLPHPPPHPRSRPALDDIVATTASVVWGLGCLAFTAAYGHLGLCIRPFARMVTRVTFRLSLGPAAVTNADGLKVDLLATLKLAAAATNLPLNDDWDEERIYGEGLLDFMRQALTPAVIERPCFAELLAHRYLRPA